MEASSASSRVEPAEESTASAPHLGLSLLGLLLAAVVPLLLFNTYHFTHDRSRNFVARDFAVALLSSLDRNAILFTNGDNDTFPLWYAQEVENVRKDVRVVNLSLLNTPWYVHQIANLPPRVPLTLTSEQIDDLRAYRDSTGQIVLPKDIAVASIIEASGGQRPVYFAFSVPDAQDYEGYTVREAFAYRVVTRRVTETEAVALPKVRSDLAHLRIRGMLTPDGRLDPSVYRDDITYGFLQNGIAMAHFELGSQASRLGNTEEAIHEMLRAADYAPQLPFFLLWAGRTMEGAGQKARAESLYKAAEERNPQAYEFPWRLGLLYLQTGRRDAGYAALRRAATMPNATFDPTRDLTSYLVQNGDMPHAVEAVTNWLAMHPEDTTAAKILSALNATSGAPQ